VKTAIAAASFQDALNAKKVSCCLSLTRKMSSKNGDAPSANTQSKKDKDEQ